MRTYHRQLLSTPIFENSSVEMKVPRFQEAFEFYVGRFGNLINLLHQMSFELDNGYVVPQGFEFSYYLAGTPSILEIPAKEQVQ